MGLKSFGKYTILKKLASGGMAEIFLASDLSPTGLCRFLVIKRTLAQHSENKDFKDMFKNEGKIACTLKHRNIAPIYEFGIENNQFYLAMEHISGKNLKEFMQEIKILKKPIKAHHAAYLIKEISSGLNYAHNAIESSTGLPLNLIHRDISPQNIMISFDGEIKIIDFGISKIADTDLTRAGHLKGKFSYMSPEQTRGEAIDSRSDIFCLGIIFWELLAGQKLFSAKSELEVLKKIKACNIPNIQKINPQVPTQLADILNRALNKNKNLRYKTASSLEKELNIFLNKNYPEFSQYDFMSCIKNIYSKQILNERENLKVLSKKFKNHISKLNDLTINLEMNMISNNLDLPSIEIPKTGQQIPTQTQISASEEEISDETKKIYLYDDTNISSVKEKSQNTVNPSKKEINHNQNTVNPSKKERNHNQNTDIKLHNAQENQDFDIVQNPQKISLFYDSINSSRSSSPKTSKNKFNTNTTRAHAKIPNQNLIHSIKNAITLTLILIIGVASYYGFKNKEKIIHSKIINNFIMKDKKSKITQQQIAEPKKNIRNIGNISIKKIFVQSKPSGAKVYLNRQLVAHTPSIVKINLNHTNELIVYKPGYLRYSIKRKKHIDLGNSLFIVLEKKQLNRRPKSITIIK